MAPHVNLGDLLLLPNGTVEPVVAWDLPRDMVLTVSGRWYAEDIEVIPPPSDRNQLDAWLDAPSWRVFQCAPATRVDTYRCHEPAPAGSPTHSCTCKHCYANLHINRRGVIVERHHFRDNDACRCAAGMGCACVVTD